MADVDFSHSTKANEARVRKAMALEEQMLTDGIPSGAVPVMPPKARRRVERAAGVRRASDETWALATAFLKDREGHR